MRGNNLEPLPAHAMFDLGGDVTPQLGPIPRYY